MKIKEIVSGETYTNTYIVWNENKNAIIIDPAFSPEKIKEAIKENSLTVRYIFLTHGHYDHFFSARILKDFYDCPIVINENDAPYLTNPTISLVNKFGGSKDVLVLPDIVLKDMQKIVLDEKDTNEALEFTFINTPGHTPGGSCIICEDVLFSGDTVFKDTIGRTDFPGGDYNTLLNSLKTKLIPLEVNYKIYPGHENSTTLNEEKLYNEFFLLCK